MAKVKDELKELKRLDEKGLQNRLNETREKLRDLSFKTRADEIRDNNEAGKTRRTIARILTILRQRRK